MATKTACSVCGREVGNERNAMHVSSAIHQAALMVETVPVTPTPEIAVVGLPDTLKDVLKHLENGSLDEKQKSEHVAKELRLRMKAYGWPNAEHPKTVLGYMNLAQVKVYENRTRKRGESGLRPGG
jgi:hypothetical protein